MNMKWIGLTGGIGTGKSTVANLLKSKGIPVISADELAHQALGREGSVYEQVVSHFGSDILDDGGEINRRLLGEKVFGHPQELQFLESVVHPEVRRLALQFKQQSQVQAAPLAIYDVPLLFEKNMQQMFDAVVVVTCSEEQQIQRVMKRNQLSEQQVRKRLSHQMSMAKKEKQADFVIENHGDMEQLQQQVEEFLHAVGYQANE